MKSPIPIDSISGNEAEKTLRLIAALPAPKGLEERMHAALGKSSRRATVLAWPEPSSHGWMRAAAAAAIVFVVAGGGWSIAARLHPAEPAKVIAMPRVTASGGFSSAGAMRTPQTFNVPAPVPVQSAPAVDKTAKAAHAKHAAKLSPLK